MLSQVSQDYRVNQSLYRIQRKIKVVNYTERLKNSQILGKLGQQRLLLSRMCYRMCATTMRLYFTYSITLMRAPNVENLTLTKVR